MSFLTNKHVVVAMLVAPILAIIAYFAVDAIVTETPHKALEGQSYSMAGKSNCRYESGACDIENGEMKIRIKPISRSSQIVSLSLTSDIALEQVFVQLTSNLNDQVFTPNPALDLEADGKSWQVEVTTPALDQMFRIVVIREGVKFFTEVSTVFLLTESD